jgi:hypothetical protein
MADVMIFQADGAFVSMLRDQANRKRAVLFVPSIESWETVVNAEVNGDCLCDGECEFDRSDVCFNVEYIARALIII